MFCAFTSASAPSLEVKCCASKSTSMYPLNSQILTSANAAAKISRSYGYLSSTVEDIKTTNLPHSMVVVVGAEGGVVGVVEEVIRAVEVEGKSCVGVEQTKNMETENGVPDLETEYRAITFEKPEAEPQLPLGSVGNPFANPGFSCPTTRVCLRLPCDFGDFGVSFAACVAGRYTRRGGPRSSVRGDPLLVLTRGP